MQGKLFKALIGIIFSFTVLLIAPEIIAKAADAYIVYDDPNGFPSQAKYMANTYSSSGYKMYYVRSSDDFIKAWNAIASESHTVENLILMLHGGTGVLYFYQESGWSNYNDLAYMGTNLDGNIMLLSCDGGTGGTSSVAYNLSKRGACAVVAAKDSAVNYNWLLNKNPDLDDKTNGQWVKISAIKGTTYKCTELGTSWKFSYLN